MCTGVRAFNKTIKTAGLCSHFSINEHSMQNRMFTILKAVINAIEICINCHVFSVDPRRHLLTTRSLSVRYVKMRSLLE